MKIRITGQSGEQLFPFETSGPWQEFKKEVISQGHTIALEGDDLATDALISHRHSKTYLKEAKKNKIPISRRVLVIWEPYIVLKKSYSKRVIKQYGHVYTPSPIWASRVMGKVFRWPQDKVRKIEDFGTWAHRENRFVMIQGNKFSTLNGELYSLRRKTILELKENIHLYGTNWNQGIRDVLWTWLKSAIKNFPSKISWKSLYGIRLNQESYRGPSEDKSKTLSNYRLAIVIENSADFVSEKLFDCVSAGCLVIYVGPKLDQFKIDDKFLFCSPADINEIVIRCISILSMSSDQQYALAKAQNELLRQISTEWENSKVLCELARTILKDISEK